MSKCAWGTRPPNHSQTLALSRVSALSVAVALVAGLLDVLLSMGVKFAGEEGDELAGEVLEATQFFFRDSKPADEARSEMRTRVNSSMKKRQEKMKERDDIKRNPIEAYPVRKRRDVVPSLL